MARAGKTNDLAPSRKGQAECRSPPQTALLCRRLRRSAILRIAFLACSFAAAVVACSFPDHDFIPAGEFEKLKHDAGSKGGTGAVPTGGAGGFGATTTGGFGGTSPNGGTGGTTGGTGGSNGGTAGSTGGTG